MRTNAENLWKRRNRQKQRKSIEKTTENQQKQQEISERPTKTNETRRTSTE